jgi:hypothetical protein
VSDYQELVAETDTHRLTLLPMEDTDGCDPRHDTDCNLGVMWVKYRDHTLGDEQYHWRTRTTTAPPEHEDLTDFIRQVEDFMPSLSALNEAIVKHLVRKHGATAVLPLYLLDHSGISISGGRDMVQDRDFRRRQGGRDHFACDPGGWDTSYVGFIFDTARTREVCGTPLDRVEECLADEVRTYNAYLTGDVWGYRIEERVQRSGRTTTTETVVRPGAEPETSTRTLNFDREDWEVTDDCWGFVGHKWAAEAARDAFSPYATKEVA